MDPPANNDDLIQQFCALTQATPAEANSALSSCDWNIEAAVQSWFTSQDDDDDDDYDDEPQEGEQHSGAATAGSSLQSGGATAGGGQSRGQKGGIRTLRDIGSAPQDEDDSDEKDQDYFAGGEKSGLAVQGSGGGGGAQDHIQGILDRAKRNLPRPGGDDAPSRDTHFSGRGVTLGGDDAPSRVIQDASPPTAQSRRQERVRRTLHLWQDGFSVDDGDLFRYDDPANRETLAMIQSGRAPIHLLNVVQGQEVDLELDVRKDDKYVKPKAQYKPFSGEGRRLGSPTPGPASLAAGAPAAASTPATSSTATSAAPAQVTVDEAAPTLALQIRLGDGTRLQSRFNTSHTIGDVYDFVNRASPASTQRAYALMTTFPSKELEDKSAVLGDLADFKRGGVVVQKWK